MAFTKTDFYKLHLQFASACGFQPTTLKGFRLRVARGWGLVELLATPMKSKKIHKHWASYVHILEDMPADILDVFIKELNEIRNAGFEDKARCNNLASVRQKKFDAQHLLNQTLEARNSELVQWQLEKVKENATLLNIIDNKKIVIENKNSELRELREKNNNLRLLARFYTLLFSGCAVWAVLFILIKCI